MAQVGQSDKVIPGCCRSPARGIPGVHAPCDGTASSGRDFRAALLAQATTTALTTMLCRRKLRQMARRLSVPAPGLHHAGAPSARVEPRAPELCIACFRAWLRHHGSSPGVPRRHGLSARPGGDGHQRHGGRRRAETPQQTCDASQLHPCPVPVTAVPQAIRCAGPQAAVQWLFDNEGRDDPALGPLPAPSFASKPAEPSRPPQVIMTTHRIRLLLPTEPSGA